MPFAPIYAERLHYIADLPAEDPGRPASPEALARRAKFDAPFGPPEPTTAATEDREIPGPCGPIPIRIYRPTTTSPTGPGLVWYHGGAFAFGDLDMPEGDLVSAGLVTRTGGVVVSVDYRLAKDGVHHPIPHDDCYAAYLWVLEHAEELGIDPRRVAVGGASAGGALSASVALHGAREGKAPWQALLAYPVAHHGLPDPSPELVEKLADTPLVLRFLPDGMTLMDDNYLGDGEVKHPEYAYPASATDLGIMPPTYIENCEYDDLRSSGEAFGAQLAEAGVDVEVFTALGVPHGYFNAIGSAVTAEGLDRFAERLRR